jgi:hypothetical protein
MYDPFEYFVGAHRDGLLKTDFKNDLGKVSYHVPCQAGCRTWAARPRNLKLSARA